MNTLKSYGILFTLITLLSVSGKTQIDQNKYNGPIYPNKNKEVLFYPNPSIERMYVHFPYEVPYIQVKVYSYIGEKVRDFEVKNTHFFDIDVEYLPEGLYFIHVITPDEIFLKQIQVMHLMSYPDRQ